jgi:hypothetical protein
MYELTERVQYNYRRKSVQVFLNTSGPIRHDVGCKYLERYCDFVSVQSSTLSSLFKAKQLREQEHDITLAKRNERDGKFYLRNTEEKNGL